MWEAIWHWILWRSFTLVTLLTLREITWRKQSDRSVNLRHRIQFVRRDLVWGHVSRNVCDTRNMIGVLPREPTRAPRDLTWRKRSDRSVNLRHIIHFVRRDLVWVHVSRNVCDNRNMRGVLPREPTKVPREITWRKQSDRSVNLRHRINFVRPDLVWGHVSRNVCDNRNMRGVMARERIRAPREITWRKQSDGSVNLPHRIQCQIASHIPTARVTSHELTWREYSMSPALVT
jgi:hypothetical protein